MKIYMLKSTIFILLSVTFQLINGLSENDPCTNTNDERGQCKQVSDCKNLESVLKSGIRPKICGFTRNRSQAIICCPNEMTTSALHNNRGGPDTRKEDDSPITLVRQKCAEYGKLVKEEIDDPVMTIEGSTTIVDHCGTAAEAMILGGEKAAPKEFPHMALIGYKNPPEYICGGSLISERFILSAAHCSRPRRKGPATWAKLGELDTSNNFDDADPVIHKISQIIDHPEYDANTLYNDIALFKLENIVTFTPYIRPICLHTDQVLPEGYLTASGWGHTVWGGSSSSSLMKVSLETVSHNICNFNYSKTISLGKQIPQGISQASMMCAGKDFGKDTCQGDSGGPLQKNLTEPYCMYDLVGITSFGRGCGLGYPGVYTRVSYFIPWIVRNVWPDNQ